MNAYRDLVNLHNITLNENCLKKYQHIGELFDAEGKLVMNQPSMCFLPRHGAQFVKTPILFIQSAYDTWLSASVWMSGKHFGKGKRLSHRNSCTNIGECKDEHVLRQVQLYDWIGRDSLIEFLTESHHSVWRQICVTHGNTNNAMYRGVLQKNRENGRKWLKNGWKWSNLTF